MGDNLKRPVEFYRRQLPDTCIDFSSQKGKQLFRESLEAGYMDSYFSLAAQFCTQDEPAFCGLSTLVMALNALEIDPQRVWKGPWRWYHETMLDCCVPLEEIKQTGITLKEFVCLAQCNALDTRVVQATETASMDDFRSTVADVCSNQANRVLAASYSRSILKQTGSGHFSPIAGYHPREDLVLILDTARFKYQPHWVKIPLLFEAMTLKDPDTDQPRGYVVLERRSETATLNLYRLSSYFNITSVSSRLSTTSLNFVQEWSAWLGMGTPSDSRNQTEFANQAVEMILSAVSKLEDNESLLSTRVTKCISSEHRCIIKQILSATAATELYDITTEHLEKSCVKDRLSRKLCQCCSAEGCCVVNNTEGGNVKGRPSCCEENTDVLQQLSCGYFVTVLLFSWPYKKLEGTNGLRMNEYVEKVMQDSNSMLRAETTRLKQQLEIVLGLMNI